MSRPNVTDEIVSGLEFATACVLDQRASSHARGDHSFDPRYYAALDAINAIVLPHKKKTKKAAKKAAKKVEVKPWGGNARFKKK
jgi:hypothetical protein